MALISVKTRGTADRPLTPLCSGHRRSGGFVALFEFVVGIGETEGRGASGRLRIPRLFRSGSDASVGRAVRQLACGSTLLARLNPLGEQNTEIMLCVLKIVFGHHPVAGGTGIPRQLKIFFIDMRGGAADLDVRPRRIEWPAVIVLRPSAAST